MRLETLIQFRQAAGLSKVAMAHLLKVSLSYYEKVEAGKRNPSYHFMIHFSREFPESDLNSIFFNSNVFKEAIHDDVY